MTDLSTIEIMRIRGCLFREALYHKELAEYYDAKGYSGIARSEFADSWAIMELREKFQIEESG